MAVSEVIADAIRVYSVQVPISSSLESSMRSLQGRQEFEADRRVLLLPIFVAKVCGPSSCEAYHLTGHQTSQVLVCSSTRRNKDMAPGPINKP